MIMAYLSMLRPAQWLKNLMLFFPPFLGGIILQSGIAQKSIMPFVSFCLASSATYIFNDIIDRKKDFHHPKKRHRSIPSGKVPLHVAAVLSVLIMIGALFCGLLVSAGFVFILLAYVMISISYTIRLKDIPIVDIFCISAGFLFRLQAGGEAFGVIISEWLFLTVFLLSIFLSTGKRLSEKNSMGKNAGDHRKTLTSYPPGFLEGTLYMTSGAVLVTYTVYVVSRHALVYTVPLCCFGLLRYIFRVKSGYGGDPTESLLRDKTIFAVGIIWVVMIGWDIYCRYK
jgi:decaprenyl-phosphate phosphoribosyltransferase